MPDFAPRALLLRLAEINSIETEIDTRKLLFLGCLVTEPKMAPSLRNLLRVGCGWNFVLVIQTCMLHKLA